MGSKNVGVARTDEGGLIAFPECVVERFGCEEKIVALAKKYKVAHIIIGESKNNLMQDNPIMTDIRAFALFLEKEGFTVILVPEFFTSIEAARLGKGTDDEAAAIILQSYIDAKRVASHEGNDF